jgi:hypothetical protein
MSCLLSRAGVGRRRREQRLDCGGRALHVDPTIDQEMEAEAIEQRAEGGGGPDGVEIPAHGTSALPFLDAFRDDPAQLGQQLGQGSPERLVARGA